MSPSNVSIETPPRASSPVHNFGTLAVHAGSPHDPTTGAVIEPVRFPNPSSFRFIDHSPESRSHYQPRSLRPASENQWAHMNIPEAQIQTGPPQPYLLRILPPNMKLQRKFRKSSCSARARPLRPGLFLWFCNHGSHSSIPCTRLSRRFSLRCLRRHTSLLHQSSCCSWRPGHFLPQYRNRYRRAH